MQGSKLWSVEEVVTQQSLPLTSLVCLSLQHEMQIVCVSYDNVQINAVHMTENTTLYCDLQGIHAHVCTWLVLFNKYGVSVAIHKRNSHQ